MSKQKIYYKCSECTYQTVKWLGCCPGCSAWSTLEEQKENNHPVAALRNNTAKPVALIPLSQVPTHTTERMLAGIDEWDRVVGGGIMPNSLLILTGDPGIGKSTLLLQISNRLAQKYKVFYFSTEESLNQVKLRADRLSCMNDNLLFSDKAQLEEIITTTQQERPDIIIIDSIQSCYTSQSQAFPGSVGQLREAAFQLMRLAKEDNITVLVTGHITKDGNIAGPKTLEHMVDGVFYLQGDDRWQTRILRSVKNRFGTINELGFFDMSTDGLKEVPNINEHLLNEMNTTPGSSLVSIIEGSRPLLLEVQALTIDSKLAMPQRVISGPDHKQVVLIAAILEKYLQIKLSSQDIFIKVSSGFKLPGSETDLGIALAILSSYFQQPLPEKCIVLGEIGLTGHIKPITQITMYIREAEKFGIKQILVAQQQNIEKHPAKSHDSRMCINCFRYLVKI